MIPMALAIALLQDPVQDRLRRVEEEVEKLKKEREAPSAELPFHIFGYGEIHYNRPRPDVMTRDARSIAEIHRLVLGVAVDLASWVHFSTEVDFEHSFREPEVEFVNVDFLLCEWFNLRAGMPLMPVGSLNEVHEPPRYFSVERPHVHSLVVPTTWQEPGAGFFGSAPFESVGLRYRLYLVQGLDPTQFRSTNAIRSARAKGRDDRSFADGFAVTGRVECQPLPQVTVGASGYGGRCIRRDVGLANVATDLYIGTADLHVEYWGFSFQLEGAQIFIPNADDVSAAVAAANRPVAERIDGWYIEFGFDVLSLLPDTDLRLVVFGRHEFIDTQADIPRGFAAAPGNQRRIDTIGVAFFPIPNVAVKVDYEMWVDDLGRDVGRINVGLAFEYHP